MLYLIGGVGRVGKSMLAQRLIEAKPMYCASTDLLQWVLGTNAPELGVRTGGSAEEQEAAFRPFLSSLCHGQIFHYEHSVVEGHVIHPRFVRSIVGEGVEVRSCFLGVSSLDREVFLANQGRNDWLLRRSSEEQQEVIETIVPESMSLEAACQANDLPFIDMAAGPHEQRLNYALELLLAKG